MDSILTLITGAAIVWFTQHLGNKKDRKDKRTEIALRIIRGVDFTRHFVRNRGYDIRASDKSLKQIKKIYEKIDDEFSEKIDAVQAEVDFYLDEKGTKLIEETLEIVNSLILLEIDSELKNIIVDKNQHKTLEESFEKQRRNLINYLKNWINN